MLSTIQYHICDIVGFIFSCQIYDMESSKQDISRKVGTKIRMMRLAKGFTIEKLAAEAGMEYTQLSRIELGQINTSLFQIYKLSKALSMNMCELFINIH